MNDTKKDATTGEMIWFLIELFLLIVAVAQNNIAAAICLCGMIWEDKHG